MCLSPHCGCPSLSHLSTCRSFTKLLPHLCFLCGSDECGCYPTHMSVCINSLGSCCSGNISSKYGIVGLKIATSFSLCRPSISSCLIQKTLVFITHTCFTRDTEPTVVLNKHTAVTLFHCQFALHPC